MGIRKEEEGILRFDEGIEDCKNGEGEVSEERNRNASKERLTLDQRPVLLRSTAGA